MGDADRALPSGSTPSSRPPPRPSRRSSGTGCPPTPWTAGSSASSRARRSSSPATRRSVFNDAARLDEGAMWATAFALTEVTPEVEAPHRRARRAGGELRRPRPHTLPGPRGGPLTPASRPAEGSVPPRETEVMLPGNVRTAELGGMTSNTRVVVIGAGLAGVRLARRLGELGVPALLVGDEGARAAQPGAAGRGCWPAGTRRSDHPPAAGRVCCAPGSPASTGPPGPSTAPTACRSPTTRWSWPPAPTRCCPVARPLHARPPPARGRPRSRTMDDCLGLAKAAARPGVPEAVVVGGGLLGVSAARALAVRGAQVVLAQQAERLMERQLDPDASRLVLRHLTERWASRCAPSAGCGTCAASPARSARWRWPTGTRSTPTSWSSPAGYRPRTGLAERAEPRRAQGRPRRRRAAHLRPAHPRHRRLRPARRHRLRPGRPGPRTGRRARRAAGRRRRCPLHRHPAP